MHFEAEIITCKSGKELRIVSIGPDYAEQFLDFMHQVSNDTHFMSRYGNEVGQTEKDILAERERLNGLFQDDRQGMLSIFDGNRIIGNIAIRNVGKGRKTKHRCSIGLAVRKEYHGEGLGTILMEYAIKFAKIAGKKSFTLLPPNLLQNLQNLLLLVDASQLLLFFAQKIFLSNLKLFAPLIRPSLPSVRRVKLSARL